ncbi:MAG TPA: membrane protein insertase YidC [Bacteroidales bacterium]|nr:membrane protein insertase YidC [Bacteroidales bacterium]
MGYSIWMSPSKEEIQKSKQRADSIALVQKNDSVVQAQLQAAKDSISKMAARETVVVATNDTATAGKKYGSFASVSNGENKFYTIENEVLKLKISSRGGRIWSAELKNYKTHDSLPLVLFQGDSNRFDLEFNTEDLKSINTGDLYFTPSVSNESKGDSLAIAGRDSLQFALRLNTSVANGDAGQGYIEYIYTLRKNDYMIGYQVRSVGMGNIGARNTRDIAIAWKTDMLRQEKSFKTELSQATIYYMDKTGEVDNLKETKDSEERITSAVKWVSYKTQFFSASLIAGDAFSSADVATASFKETDGRLLKNMKSDYLLAYDPAKDQSYDMQFYLGPNKFRTLKKYDLNLERQIPLGWSFAPIAWFNKYVVVLIFNWLEKYGINYGIIILIMTVMLKIVLFPVAYKTYMSSAKMRILKPEVDEINAKYPKQEDAMKKQQATMTLYKKAGANPMSGCVPMLLQFPILLAMFRFFPASIELRQQSFLWAHDLSSYDSIWNLPFNIPFYGDHVSLFTLLMTISTIIYTKINNDMMGSTQQMPGMKTMMYLMPVMFLGFFNNYSAGLSYYYLLANLFTFAQMWLMRRFVDEAKLHARIQENKAKPVKKSSFQQRLEDMAKQQGYNTRKK